MLLLFGIFVGLLTIFLLKCIWKRMQIFSLRDRLGLCGPETSFLYGNLHSIMQSKYKEQPMQILKDWRNQYGDVFGYYFGPKLTVYVADLDMIKEILIKKFDCFVDRMKFALEEPSPSCFSLISLTGEKWKTIRNTITPTFTASKMKQMAYIINEKIDTFMNNMDNNSALDQTFNIYEDFKALTLDVIGQCAFAMQVHCQTDHQDPFMIKTQEVFKLFDMNDFPLAKIAYIFPEVVAICSKLREYTKIGLMEQFLLRNLRKVVEQRKRGLQANESIDALQLLLEQQADKESESKRKWKLTDDIIVGNAYIFLLAGYETTSTALGFTAWLLAKHKDVQKRLQHEIDEKLINGKTQIDYDFIHKLPYMDAVFHESLRVYPPVVHFVQRLCIKECHVGNTKFVPGVLAHIPVREIHSDPDIWPEPEKFDPDRFLNDNTYNAVAWLPFGAGPRNCIGMRFADMVFKMALARLLTKYTIEFGPDSEDPLCVIDTSVLLRPKNGVKIRLIKRNAN